MLGAGVHDSVHDGEHAGPQVGADLVQTVEEQHERLLAQPVERQLRRGIALHAAGLVHPPDEHGFGRGAEDRLRDATESQVQRRPVGSAGDLPQLAALAVATATDEEQPVLDRVEVGREPLAVLPGVGQVRAAGPCIGQCFGRRHGVRDVVRVVVAKYLRDVLDLDRGASGGDRSCQPHRAVRALRVVEDEHPQAPLSERLRLVSDCRVR